MNVLQINRNYSNGGAAVVAKRLHNNLNNLSGYKSTLLCRNSGSSTNEGVIELYPNMFGRIKSILIDKFEQVTGYQYFYQKNLNSIIDLSAFKQADVIHFHITHGGYIDQKFIIEVAKLKPVVWTFHDMWALTGRCAHSYDCDKWENGCGMCLYTHTYPRQYIDRSAYLWKLKKDLYSSVNIHVVSPSKWLCEKISKSIVKHWSVSIVPNSVDLLMFDYRKDQQDKIRGELCLPLNRKIFLFVAHGGVNNEFKGFGILNKALHEVSNDGIQPYLLVIGGNEKTDLKEFDLSGESIGVVNDESLLSAYYTASDFYIMPSNQENLPLTIIESLACGTPVVAFNVGGIPEMINHQVTGYLAEKESIRSLIDGITWAYNLSSKEYLKSSESCRMSARKNYSIDDFVKKHIAIYKNIIKG